MDQHLLARPISKKGKAAAQSRLSEPPNLTQKSGIALAWPGNIARRVGLWTKADWVIAFDDLSVTER
jgi:hypothetical protein